MATNLRKDIFCKVMMTTRLKHFAILMLVLFSLAQSNIFAQNKDDKDEKLIDRFYFGGNLALQFGTFTNIQVSPLAGFYITPKWSAGLGLTYMYINDKFNNYDTHIYGGKVFTRYDIIADLNKVVPFGFQGRLMLYSEFEPLNLSTQFDRANLYPDQDRFWIGNVWIGGGLGLPLGGRAFANIMVL